MNRQNHLELVVMIAMFLTLSAFLSAAEPTAMPGREQLPAEKPLAWSSKAKQAEITPGATRLDRIEQTLATMEKGAEKYQYEGLFLSPDAKPVEGLIAFPMDKFLEQVNEIVALAEETSTEMAQRQTAVRTRAATTSASEAAVVAVCGSAMNEIATLVRHLWLGAMPVRMNAGKYCAKGVIEGRRFELTASRVRTLTERCHEAMTHGDMSK